MQLFFGVGAGVEFSPNSWGGGRGRNLGSVRARAEYIMIGPKPENPKRLNPVRLLRPSTTI